MPNRRQPSARNGTEALGGRLSAARSVGDRLEVRPVRKHILPASAILAIVLAVAACGSSTPSASGSPTPACANASAPHHAYVVVEHLSGKSLQRCVGFTSDTIGGQALMDQSGINYQTQTFNFGKAVCALDSVPAAKRALLGAVRGDRRSLGDCADRLHRRDSP